MANGKLLRQLVRAGVEGDQEAFKRASEAVIAEERDKQHHLLANDLEKLLYGRPATASSLSVLNLAKAVPSDKERGVDLIDMRQPTRELTDLVVNGEVRSAIERVLLEHNRESALTTYGLEPARKLLFFGPPGCGKTLTAEVIAMELGLPLAIVRLDSVISSYLGETAANLRKVFDFISAQPVVALFDEFDALAKERNGDGDHGELRRVVNAVLQMIDEYRGRSVLVAATNHEGLLDSAIWRRFDETVKFEIPNASQIIKLLQSKLRGVRRNFEPSDASIASRFKGMSHADIERVLRRAIKEMILQGREFLEQSHIESALSHENRQLTTSRRCAK
ncbi:AAA family ATPase [Paraburkholderia susongensis]|uniref:ATPase family associated with various cellular activities (AAA) n=1 Tax=Paraburkholderia susongensis TaxID=1515439 RepID=A0A1X7M7E2_9BURK|nr:ATP-binding protein [Paraburkholderia susongensis]SMG61289.1 ATPase family associated with various cellular activities (AAA) [Paraburkholderia susongensis]